MLLGDHFTGTACEVDPYYALCQVSECLRQVDFLESSPPTVFARDLTHEKHHGRRVLLRGVDADAGVREARPAGHEGDAGPAAELRGRLGHIGRCSFVSASDHAERVACVVQRIEHIQVTFACHGEYMSRIVGAQPLNDRIGNASRSHFYSSPPRPARTISQDAYSESRGAVIGRAPASCGPGTLP